ncbi:protein phosphatase 1 regulatory subunit 12A isoform X2 [Hippocampus comes]|uniref:protein phosphatase 1 regulatory subunit 12A isoform X2 n=1 Tax=Hippocampus comes TaxID=109280 RepID=UPI00094EBD64|nr:PREDICTED: protein phosphatase 1 regulatory subunit 12A-like isoform X2 [Hippocampus comes]
MAATDQSRSESSKQRRQDQLQRWLGSETDRTDSEARYTASSSGTRRARVRFAQGAVFMAACSAGDQEEVAALLRQGADIAHANKDGLTALHQACIDENAEMVQFLVESGSNVNTGDNEGWTPLHAAASSGFLQIAKYLIEHGAHVGAVNCEGKLPLDVATEDPMERLLKAEIKKQGIDVDQARKEEERIMLQDAKAMREGGSILTPHPNTKATALHVAAAKGYIEVLKVLLECGVDVDCQDVDGWSPLHAAAHWGQEEVCTLLADHMCDMNAVNNVGQTPLDVADEDLVDTLEELQKKQNALRTEKEKQTPVIETSLQTSTVPVRTRRTSISRMSSKEKICLHEREKHPPPALQSSPTEDEEDEGRASRSLSQSQPKASSSSSSEEESESESDAESEKAKNREIINNLNNKRNTSSLLPTAMPVGTTANQVKKEPGKPIVSEAPGSWRTSLRKAGSSVTLGSAGLSDSIPDQNKPPESGLGMTRSASSPRLSSETEPKEPRLARVPPIPTRRLFSIPDSSSDNSNSWLSRSSSYTRRLHSQSGNDLTSSNPCLPRSSSYGRRLDEASVNSSSTGTSTSGLSRLNSALAQSGKNVLWRHAASQRLPQEQTKDQSTLDTSSNPQNTTGPESETKQRRKSYLTPVRDEEAEAQRKARSRHARQSRRSTQGVTLTDLQEAEKTMKQHNKVREKEEDEKEKEREAKSKKGEEGEVSWRSRIASLQKSDLLGLTQPTGTPRPQTTDGRATEASAGEYETERWALERRERRQARARRKAQRSGELDDNDPSGEEEFSSSRLDLQSDQLSGSRSSVHCNEGGESKDFKKLFEEVTRENSQLQSQLQDTQRIVSQTRLDLEKATQRQERLTDCSALLDLERKDRRMLERRMADLEEELKVLGDLRADNQRLKDENGALIRVISKLSK